MSWRSASPILHQIQKGDFYQTRYHAELIEGQYSNSLQGRWLFGNCHYERYTCPEGKLCDHIIESNGLNNGRQEMESDFVRYNIIASAHSSFVDMNNVDDNWNSYNDGKVWIFIGSA